MDVFKILFGSCCFMQCLKIKFNVAQQGILTVGPFAILCVCVFKVSLIFTHMTKYGVCQGYWVFGLVHDPVF
jgi:hypothetical protein